MISQRGGMIYKDTGDGLVLVYVDDNNKPIPAAPIKTEVSAKCQPVNSDFDACNLINLNLQALALLNMTA